MRDADARRALKAELERANCRVHQPDDPPLFTREPTSSMAPVHWRANELEPLLERIGAEIDLGSGGQRRTLRLANPGLAFGTTPSFWGSIQVILPGEVAAAHRHSAAAFRFIMKGRGASTTVDGERFAMDEGDLVLTPAWAWHDHEHRGAEPMVWLDVLDISLMRAMNATFFEPYPGEIQPVARTPAGSPLAYPRGKAEAALGAAQPNRFDDLALQYPALPTMAMRLSRLRAGFEGARLRHTGSKLYYAVRGSGSSEVGAARYDWAAGDFFAVPPWTWHAHRNPSPQDAVLFEVDDTPALKALGYYREEAI